MLADKVPDYESGYYGKKLVLNDSRQQKNKHINRTELYTFMPEVNFLEV